MIKIKMGVISGKFVGWTPNIAAVAQLLSHRSIDLKRQLVSKNQVGRLQCPSERRNNDIYKIKLTDFGPSLLSLSFSERRDRCIEYHGIRFVRVVNRIEGRLSVSNKVNCHFEFSRMLRIVELPFKYLVTLWQLQSRLHRKPIVVAFAQGCHKASDPVDSWFPQHTEDHGHAGQAIKSPSINCWLQVGM